jgi:hypothetical protein
MGTPASPFARRPLSRGARRSFSANRAFSNWVRCPAGRGAGVEFYNRTGETYSALMNLPPILIASLVLAIALALMADRALAAAPQMPEDFQGRWCTSSDTLKDDWTRIIPEAQTARTITILSRSLPRG